MARQDGFQWVIQHYKCIIRNLYGSMTVIMFPDDVCCVFYDAGHLPAAGGDVLLQY
jgi:hypothetical protein